MKPNQKKTKSPVSIRMEYTTPSGKHTEIHTVEDDSIRIKKVANTPDEVKRLLAEERSDIEPVPRVRTGYEVPELDTDRLEEEIEKAEEAARFANQAFYDLQDKIIYCDDGAKLQTVHRLLLKDDKCTGEQIALLSEQLLLTAWKLLQIQLAQDEWREIMKTKYMPKSTKYSIFKWIRNFFQKLIWLFSPSSI